MRTTDLFPPAPLGPDDFRDGERELVIVGVVLLGIGAEYAPRVFFHGCPKSLKLDRDNAYFLAQIFGDDTRGWIGERVTVHATELAYDGTPGPILRVKIHPRERPKLVSAPAWGDGPPRRA